MPCKAGRCNNPYPSMPRKAGRCNNPYPSMPRKGGRYNNPYPSMPRKGGSQKRVRYNMDRPAWQYSGVSSTVPACASRKYRHYSGKPALLRTLPLLVFLPCVPSNFTGTTTGNRHYSGQPALLNRHHRGLALLTKATMEGALLELRVSVAEGPLDTSGYDTLSVCVAKASADLY